MFSAAIRRDSVFSFFRHVRVSSCEMSLVCHLKCSYSCFSSHSLFSSYIRSVDPHVVSTFFSGFNQSSSALFYVVFKSLYGFINFILNAGKSSSSFFSGHLKRQRHFWDVMPYTSSSVTLFSGLIVSVIFSSRVSNEGDSRSVYSVYKVPVM